MNKLWDHQSRFPYNAGVVIVRVIGDDQHVVVLAEILQRSAFHLQVVFATFANEREVRVVIADLGAFLSATQ